MIPCHGLIYVVFIFCMVPIDIHLSMREDILEREDALPPQIKSISTMATP